MENGMFVVQGKMQSVSNALRFILNPATACVFSFRGLVSFSFPPNRSQLSRLGDAISGGEGLEDTHPPRLASAVAPSPRAGCLLRNMEAGELQRPLDFFVCSKFSPRKAC